MFVNVHTLGKYNSYTVHKCIEKAFAFRTPKKILNNANFWVALKLCFGTFIILLTDIYYEEFSNISYLNPYQNIFQNSLFC